MLKNNILIGHLVATMRIIQAEPKYEKTWSACFSEAKSQVWLNPKEEYGIRPEDRALVGDNGFRPFAETKGHKKRRNNKIYQKKIENRSSLFKICLFLIVCSINNVEL